jgi:hypothetical protein
MVGNKIKMKIKINKKMNEMSAMSGGSSGEGGMVSGFAGKVPEKDDEMIVEEEFPEKVHKKTLYIQNKEGKPRDQAYAIAINMHKDGKLEELYSTSGALMSSGGHYDRSKEGHKRYVRMRFVNQGLQNFKPNRYFAENKSEERKIRIKIRKNLEEKCQKGYKTHEKRKTKKMFGKTYRNCVKAE